MNPVIVITYDSAVPQVHHAVITEVTRRLARSLTITPKGRAYLRGEEVEGA